MRRLYVHIVTCATILALASTAYSAPAAVSQPATPTPVAANTEPVPAPVTYGLIDVGGHKLAIYCTGQGSPTVILEAGGGGSANSWGWVQSGGDRNYRVCSYDRANLGRSDKSARPLSSRTLPLICIPCW